MPPKKKGGKKGKKGKKGGDDDKPKSNAGGEAGKQLDELGREFFLVQVKDLEQRLSRYQTKCDELTIANNETDEKYNQLLQDRTEIVEFLKKSLEQRQDDISNLHDKLLGLQQAKDNEKESYENQLSQLKREFQEVRDQLTSENMILGGKLSSLEEFKIQKDDLMKKFADMEEKLQIQEKNHTDKIYNLERKAVVDKDRLKKEMIFRVNNVAAEFRKVSNKQMADTTKRNIRENVSINLQLAKMSEKTKELVQENDELREREKNYKLQIDMLESTQEELAKKNHSNLKVLKMITSRARQQEAIMDDLEAKDQEYTQIEEDSNQLRQENDQLNSQVRRLELDLLSTSNSLRNMEDDRQKLAAAKERLEDVLASTAHTLKQVVTRNPDEDDLERTVNRQTMIERLLLVLNSAALLGKAPPPSDFFLQRQKAIMAPLSMAKVIPRAESSKMEESPSQQFPHYKLGDLGLIPRPRKTTTNRAAFASKVAHLSKTTRTGVVGMKSGVDLKTLTPSALARHDKLPNIGQTAS